MHTIVVITQLEFSFNIEVCGSNCDCIYNLPIEGFRPAVLKIEYLQVVSRKPFACNLLEMASQLLLGQRVLHRPLSEQFQEGFLAPSGGLQEVRGVECL